MKPLSFRLGLLLLVLSLASPLVQAQRRGAASSVSPDLVEKLLSADLGGGVRQEAVLSLRTGAKAPQFLAVLLPGTPGVLRPEVVDEQMVRSRLPGNPLIRARRLIATDQLALLAVDCRSDSGDECRESYQSSPQREKDVQAVIDLARKEVPTITGVWLVGHSAGTLAAAFMGKNNPSAYAGIIYAATISDPYRRGSFRSLVDFDYGAIRIPQVFVHHKEDPCFATSHDSVEKIARKFSLPLITVHGGSDFRGGPCEPFSQHGFRGTEGLVMRKIAEIITTGQVASGELR